MTGRPIIHVQGVHTYYGASHILRGVSLTLAPGETVGLMGRNGMGKSTLIRTIMGLARPRSGSIAIDGDDVTCEATFRIARRGIAYVPEGRGILASLSVRENIELPARSGIDGRADWTAERVLELFPRLGERLDNRGNELSGGEQQMLAIARALVTNPRVLVLDEATEGLAPLVRDEIWRTIRRVREAGIAVLVVDKAVAEVAAVADRVAVLVKGEIAFEGQPGKLIGNAELMRQHLGV
ncbi:MAG: ABC transporter ATP-binding protein [Hyphomicrobiaceae bacterium]